MTAVWTDIIKVVFNESVSWPQLWNTYVMQNVQYLYERIAPRPSGAGTGPLVGEIRMWPTSSPPTGWLLCNGQSLARSGTYADLFAVLGTTFGAADGSHFSVPNFTDRSPIGAGSTYSTGSNTGSATINIQHNHATDIAHDHANNTTGTPSATAEAAGSGSFFASSTHTHTNDVNSLGSTSVNSDNKLSTTQSVVHPVTPIYFIIAY